MPTAADALLGAGHILAEQFSEQAELRQRLREVLQRTGVLVSSRVPAEAKPAAESRRRSRPPRRAPAAKPVRRSQRRRPRKRLPKRPTATADRGGRASAAADAPSVDAAGRASAATPARRPSRVAREQPSPARCRRRRCPKSADGARSIACREWPRLLPPPVAEPPPTRPRSGSWPGSRPRKPLQKKRELKKKKLEEKKIKAFRDYFDYREEIRQDPAASRVGDQSRRAGEGCCGCGSSRTCRRWSTCWTRCSCRPAIPTPTISAAAPATRSSRLILPSLEREVRRELTDRAEAHAVGVFAKNLRNLLLQPPVHNHRILAVDPGFKSGCKLAALDQFGNLLDHGVIYLVGKPDRRDEARQKVLDLIQQHQLTVVGHRQRHGLPPRPRTSSPS